MIKEPEGDALRLFNKLKNWKPPKIKIYKCSRCGRKGSKNLIKHFINPITKKQRKVCRYGCKKPEDQ